MAKGRLLLVVSTLVALAAAADETADAADAQLPTFLANTTGPIGVLSTSSGGPVQYRQATRSLNTKLLRNEYFIDSMTHIAYERTRERFVHAKGAGAFGYFNVTHDVTDLTKAKFLNTIGKQTPLALRFSPVILKKGQSDISYNIYGYAVKFYTEDGNFDIPGFTTPIFNSRDPVDFFSFVHVFQPNPSSNLADFNAVWDLISLKPEGFFAILMAFTSFGLPASYRNVPGNSIHTMQLANSLNETIFSRFYMTPDLGIQNMTVGSTADPDYYRRDLYTNIAEGNYPSWTMWLQPLTLATVLNASAHGIDLFDTTRVIPTDQYPLREVGKIVLNENPKNHFADVETLAFCPGNLVPGIVGGVDQLFESRAFSYRQAQIHRLGINFNKIHPNKPAHQIYTYNRDGDQPTEENEFDAPNYYRNSFNGPVPADDYQPDMYRFPEIKTSNLDQTGAYFEALSEADKIVVATNIVGTFLLTTQDVIARALVFLTSVSPGLTERVTTLLAAATAAAS